MSLIVNSYKNKTGDMEENRNAVESEKRESGEYWTIVPNGSESKSKDVKKDTSLLGFVKRVLPNHSATGVKRQVDALSNNDLRLIYHELYGVDIAKYTKLKSSVIFASIRIVIQKWDGFSKGHDSEFVYSRLVEYLKKNLDYVSTVYSKNETKYTNNKEIASNIFEIRCSYRELKSIVNTDADNNNDRVINTRFIPKSTIIHSTSNIPDTIRFISNSPHIEVKIALPNFTFTRQNCHRSEYSFVELIEGYKPDIREVDTQLRYNNKNNVTESIPSSTLVEFLKNFVDFGRSAFQAVAKYDILYGLLLDIGRDVRKCTNQIELNTDYYFYVTKTPYVRYLGVENYLTKPTINFKGQIDLNKNNSPNLRLQEVIYPCIKFNLSKFKIESGPTPEFIKKLSDKCLVLKCVLCNFERVGSMAKYLMEKHISEEHGDEPNWYCYSCETEFTMKDLCMQKWKHSCKLHYPIENSDVIQIS